MLKSCNVLLSHEPNNHSLLSLQYSLAVTARTANLIPEPRTCPADLFQPFWLLEHEITRHNSATPSMPWYRQYANSLKHVGGTGNMIKLSQTASGVRQLPRCIAILSGKRAEFQ